MFDIETTSLRPYEGVVTLVGMKRRGNITLWKLWEIKDEAKMIDRVLYEISEIFETIVGYNNLKFDVPFMLERIRLLGEWEDYYYQIYNKKWFDLYQYLGNDYRSLASWLDKAEIKREHPELSGRNMPRYYEEGQYEKIIQHNIDDLNTSEKLFHFLREKNPEILPFE
jgi:uncharacterized protein YprB with RNaseH-like and TPR domain